MRDDITVAALFVQTGGCYYCLPGVDPWDEKRDARTYAGDSPVVAHPPCNRWAAFSEINYKRYGGEHNRPGNDGGCFASALLSLVLCGGVLEHPAESKAWAAFGLTKPVRGKWVRHGWYWTCEVCQSNYGHRARKATWLLYVGKNAPPELDWRRTPGTHRIGHDSKARSFKPRLERHAASATPVEFRDMLISMASGCGGAPDDNPHA